MPTIRYHAGFYSDVDGVEWDIYIDDTNYASTQNEFVVGGDGFVLEYDGQDSNEFERPIGSRVTIPFKVENSSDETFLLNLVGASEERFKVRIDRGGNLYWVGFVITDGIEIQDAYYPYEFNITAVDGLGRLQNIDYNNSGTAYTGKATFLEHFTNIFGKLDFDYFHSSDNFFETVLDWYEVQHSVVTGLDPLTVTRFDHSVFVEKDDKGVETFVSCYDVLKYFCTIWGARLYFSDGNWRFEQINTRESASFQEVRYDETFALIDYANTSYEVTIDQNTYACKAGGLWAFWPPLKKVCINYKHEHDDNLITGTVWDENNTSDYDIGNIDVGDGNVKLLFSAKFHYTNEHLDNSNIEPYIHVWRFKLKVGNYYLKRERWDSVNGIHPILDEPQWTTEVSYFEITSALILPVNAGNNTTFMGSVNINFVTPPINETGDATFALTHLNGYEGGGIVVYPTNDYDLDWDLDQHQLNVLADGDQASRENERLYCAEYSGSGTNVEEIHLETLIGDGPFKTSFSKLEVYDNSNWQFSENWRVADIGTQFTIQDLVVREILSRQKTPLRKYVGSIKGNISPHVRLFRDPHYLLFNGGTITANSDTISGTWLVIETEKTQITIAPPETVGDSLPWVVVGLPEDEGMQENPGDELAEIAVELQSTNFISDPVSNGFNEFIPIEAAVTALYQQGDKISIVNPVTGQSDTVTVSVDMQVGDTKIQIYDVLQYNYPPTSYVVPLAEFNEPDSQLSAEIVTNFFEAGATITDPDYYLATTAKVPISVPHLLLKGGTSWSVTTPTDFYVVPPIYDGAIMTCFVGVNTAGTGSGNNTIDFLVNSSTEETLNLAASETTASGTTEITLASGDIVSWDLTAVTASTPAQGCNVHLIITPELNVEFQKIQYTLNRVIRDSLVLWWKHNQSAMVPIGYGSIYFDTLQRIDCGQDPSVDITGDLTIMGWAKFDDYTNENCIIGKHDGTDGFLIYNKSTSIIFLVGLTNTCSFSTTNVPNFKWHHIAATLSGTDASIYLDGNLMDTATYTAPASNSTDLQIGAYNDTAGPFLGNITKPALWNVALTNDQINSVMNKSYSGLTASEKTGLVSWYDLNNLSDVEDKHSGNDGTVTTI